MTTKIERREKSIGGTFYGKIETSYDYAPIPIRSYDWSAYRADWDLGWPMGHGETEEEAINNLLDIEYDIECDLL